MQSLELGRPTPVTAYHDVAAVLNSRAARQALHRDSALTAELGPGPSDAFLGQSVISLHGDEHFERRRLESRLFTKAARAHLELEIVEPALRNLLQESAGQDADLMFVSRLILARLSSAVVGIVPVEDIEAAERLRVLADGMLSAIAVPFATENQSEITRHGLESREAFRREFYDPARCPLTPENAPENGGLVSLLVRTPASVASEGVLFREAILYLVASATTTTNALPHAVTDLERWLADHPERRASLSEFAFCRLVASEALRLHPPVPRLLRRLTEPMTLPSGLELTADEFVALDLIRSSRERALFGDDADDFNPLRSLPKGIWPFGFTFGGGAHMCIGRTLTVGDGGTDEEARSPQGVLTRLLHDVYAAGLTLDSERRPTRREATEKDEYLSFPVRFASAS